MSRWTDLDEGAALDALSAPSAVPTDRAGMSRRLFLQASAASAGAGALLPTWLADAAAASPIGPDDGVLVVVLLGGGNDGLNTVVPTGNGRYYDLRRSIAIAQADALEIERGLGLHPSLAKLRDRYRAGNVAVVRGVGDPAPDLSHFSAMARWMAGHDAGGASTGWLGRWLDGYERAEDLSAIAVGESIPLTLLGATRKAAAMPTSGIDAITTKSEPWIRRSRDCLRELGAGPTGNGQWADSLGAATRGALDLADRVQPLYAEKLPKGKLVTQLELAARLINADLGVRVVQASFGSFDHHTGLPWQHANLLGELDAAIEQLFTTLSPRFAGRTTLMTMSEFGRRPQANASNGTDHGTASDLFLVGARVRGGVYGDGVDLGRLDRQGNPVAKVDFRSVYASVLDRWLRADSREVLGGRYEDLGLLRAPTR